MPKDDFVPDAKDDFVPDPPLLANTSAQLAQSDPVKAMINAAFGAGKMLSGSQTGNPKLDELTTTLNQSIPMRTLDAAAAVGNYANQGNQQLSQLLSQAGPAGKILGGVLGLTSNFTMPTTRGQAFMAAAGGAMGSEAQTAQQEAGLFAQQRAAGKLPVLQPGVAQKVAAGALGVETAIKPKYAQAIIADPTIVGNDTPLPREVGAMYQQYFNSKQMVFDTNTYKEVFGSRFVPSETQAGKLRDVVENALNKLETGQDIKPEELVLAKSAASKLQDTQAAMTTPKLASQYGQAEDQLGEALAKTGDTRLQELDRMYFRAKAKEAGGAILPQNKNMSPNALRGYIMLNMLANAGGQFAEGHPIQAAFSGAKAAVMSPYLATRAIAGASGPISPLAQSLTMNAVGKLDQ